MGRDLHGTLHISGQSPQPGGKPCRTTLCSSVVGALRFGRGISFFTGEGDRGKMGGRAERWEGQPRVKGHPGVGSWCSSAPGQVQVPQGGSSLVQGGSWPGTVDGDLGMGVEADKLRRPGQASAPGRGRKEETRDPRASRRTPRARPGESSRGRSAEAGRSGRRVGSGPGAALSGGAPPRLGLAGGAASGFRRGRRAAARGRGRSGGVTCARAPGRLVMPRGGAAGGPGGGRRSELGRDSQEPGSPAAAAAAARVRAGSPWIRAPGPRGTGSAAGAVPGQP